MRPSRPARRRRAAAVTLAVAALLTVRWFDARVEPAWPRFVPTWNGAGAGPNAAHFHHAALEAFVYDSPRQRAVRDRLPGAGPRRGSLDDPETPLALKRAAHADNAAALVWLHEATRHGYAGHRGDAWTRLPSDPAFPVLPDFVRIRELSRMAGGACDVLAADGHPGRAVDLALDVATWGVHLTHDPTLVEAMIGCIVQEIGWKKAEAHADALTPAQTRAALARLEAIPDAASFDAILRHETASGASLLRETFRSGDMALLGTDVRSADALAQRIAFHALELWHTRRGIVRGYMDAMEAQARVAALPFRQAQPEAARLAERLERGDGLTWVARVAIPNTVRAREALERRTALRERLRARLALRLWRERHGAAAPADLNALVRDGLLATAPRDPFSTDGAAPLRHDPATGRVWSVGSDGIDEGGRGDDTLPPR